MRAPTRKWAGALVIVGVAAAVAVPVYRRLPWSTAARDAEEESAAAPAAAPAARNSELERRAQRLRLGVAEVEAMLADKFSFAEVPALKEHLASLRADGGGAIADTLSVRAKQQLVQKAEAELDRGHIDDGVAHYRVALTLDAHAGGEAEVAAALRTRAQSALTAQKPTEAVRWAREALTLTPADPSAHALVAESLAGARDYPAAAGEYEKALAMRPDDPALTHDLQQVRHAMAAAVTPPAAARRRSVERAAAAQKAQPAEPAAHASATPPEPAADVEQRPARSAQPAGDAPEGTAPAEPPSQAKGAAEPAAAKPPEDKAEPEPAKEAPAREAPARGAGKQPDEAAEAAPSAPAEPAADQQ